MLRTRARELVLCLLTGLLLPTTLFSGSATFTWDMNTDPGLAGYKLYYGNESRNYSEMIVTGMTPEYTVEGLQEGMTYYFVVTAYNLEGDESDFSNEISYRPGEEREIVLITPNGGEELVAGSDYTIEWEVNPFFGFVRIWLSIDAGETWTFVRAKTPNDGEYLWRVPELYSEECLLRLQDINWKPYALGVSSDFFSIVADRLGTGDYGQGMVPRSVVLDQNYPNPFNPMTTITFGVPQGENEAAPRQVTMKVYDTRGRLVRGLVEEEMNPGYYSISWDGKDDRGEASPSGIFFYVLRVDGKALSPRKMTLAR